MARGPNQERQMTGHRLLVPASVGLCQEIETRVGNARLNLVIAIGETHMTLSLQQTGSWAFFPQRSGVRFNGLSCGYCAWAFVLWKVSAAIKNAESSATCRRYSTPIEHRDRQ